MTYTEILTKYRFLVVSFILLAIMDDITTYIGVGKFGLYEYNPIASYVFSFIGIGLGLILLKIIGLLILGVVLYGLTNVFKPNIWMFRIPVAFMSLVILNNIIALIYGQSIIYYMMR